MAAGFSEDGNRLAVATWGSLSVFDVGTGQLVTRFGEHDDEEGDLYQGIALNRDGTRLVTSSLGGGRAHVWDVDTGEVLGSVPRDLLDTSPDGADVIARGFRAIAADLSAGVEIRLGAPPGDVTMILSPDRTAMAAVRADFHGSAAGRRLYEYSLPDCHPLYVDARECAAATFSPDAVYLLTARPDGTIDVSASRDAADVLHAGSPPRLPRAQPRGPCLVRPLTPSGDSAAFRPGHASSRRGEARRRPLPRPP